MTTLPNIHLSPPIDQEAVLSSLDRVLDPELERVGIVAGVRGER